MCLQGSSRSGRQFDVTVETFTGSHQQNECMLFQEKWTQFYLEEKGMHAISLFHHLWITSQRGGSLGDFLTRKDTKIFNSHCFFLSIGDPSLCPYMLQTAFKLYSLNSPVATASSNLITS